MDATLGLAATHRFATHSEITARLPPAARLSPTNHRALTWWAAGVAERVLEVFEAVRRDDARPREASYACAAVDDVAAEQAFQRASWPVFAPPALALQLTASASSASATLST